MEFHLWTAYDMELDPGGIRSGGFTLVSVVIPVLPKDAFGPKNPCLADGALEGFLLSVCLDSSRVGLPLTCSFQIVLSVLTHFDV